MFRIVRPWIILSLPNIIYCEIYDMNGSGDRMNGLYRALVRPWSTDLGLLMLRLVTGLFMAFGHGLSKVTGDLTGLTGRAAEMGFPAPGFFAYAAAYGEFVGGIFLALGFATRPSAFVIALTMVTAGFIRHAADPFGKKELAFLYLGIACVILLTGPGRFSLDRLIFDRTSETR